MGRRHELIHSDTRPYSCEYQGCGKTFRTSCHLKRHALTHNTEKEHKCRECGLSFSLEWSLKRHVKRTHNGPFQCPSCPLKFTKNKQLKQHQRFEHSPDLPWCSYCNRAFSCPGKLKQHEKTHTSTYPCTNDGCSEVFTRWSDCRKHSAACQQLQCNVCEKHFSNPSNLRAHKKTHAEERKVYQCGYESCGLMYTTKYNLKVHMQGAHDGVFPFACDKCDVRYHVKCQLEKHMKNHHSGEKKQVKIKKAKTRMLASDIAALSGYNEKMLNYLIDEDMAMKSDDEEKMKSDESEHEKMEEDDGKIKQEEIEEPQVDESEVIQKIVDYLLVL